jgi:hypothetical protein
MKVSPSSASGPSGRPRVSLISPKTITTPKEATMLGIVDWIEGFYNRRRMHSSIG